MESGSWTLESGKQLKESGIPLRIVIRNPSSTDKDWDPESKTVLDSLLWGDYNAMKRLQNSFAEISLGKHSYFSFSANFPVIIVKTLVDFFPCIQTSFRKVYAHVKRQSTESNIKGRIGGKCNKCSRERTHDQSMYVLMLCFRKCFS